MRNRYDQFAKAIVDALLGPVAHVEAGREIPGFALVADLWVEPGGAGPAELTRRGVLGRMLELGPCLVEPFSQAPRAREVRPCILKQYALDSEQVREAARDSSGEPLFPGLWVIAAGKPESLMLSMGLRAMAGWPDGFWESAEFHSFRLVVVPMLPETSETLFLRLLGRGVTLGNALRELAGQEREHGGGAWALEVLRPVLIAFRREFAQNQKDFPDDPTEDYMNALQEMEAIYAEWERDIRKEEHREGVKEGLREGVKEGLIKALEALCKVLDIELTAEQRAQVAGWDTVRLEQTVDALTTSRRWPGG